MVAFVRRGAERHPDELRVALGLHHRAGRPGLAGPHGSAAHHLGGLFVPDLSESESGALSTESKQ